MFSEGRLGVSVCYDLRFPEMYVELVKQGAQIILVPSAFTVPTGSAHWHTLLRGKLYNFSVIASVLRYADLLLVLNRSCRIIFLSLFEH
jgi:hypothetical protein